MKERLLGAADLARANCGCENHDFSGGMVRECTCSGRDEISTMNQVVNEEQEEAHISPTPAREAMMEDHTTHSGHDIIPTIFPHTRTTSSPSLTLDHHTNTPKRRPRSDPSSFGTTILTISTATTPSSLVAASTTRTFTPTGAQTIVPTYPPTSSSRQTTNQTSLATKLGLGFGIPVAVLLTILLTILLHRKYRRRRRNIINPPPPPAKTSHHQPEMASANRAFLYPRMHRTTNTSSIISASTTNSNSNSSANIVITPAPGVMTPHTPYHALTPAPRIPRRSSARPPPRPRRSTILSGPLDSHPSAVRAVSSIYEDDDDSVDSNPSQHDDNLGGNGVGDVLAEYLDFSPRHLYGPWDPGQPRSSDGSAEEVMMPRPLEPVARRQREYLAVDVPQQQQQQQHGGSGSVGDDVSPLSTSSSGQEYLPARISAMSMLSPASPERTRLRRRL